MEVAELVTKFSFTGNLRPLDALNKGLETGIHLITTITAAFTTANGYMAMVLSSADEMTQLSRETGVAIETIQELSYVASVSGSSIDALKISLKGLSEKIGEAAIQGNEDFARLGISIRDSFGNVKTADVILVELMQRFKQLNLSLQEQKAYLQRLGIDESLLQMMNLTGDEFDKLREKARLLGVVSKEQGDLIASFNDSLTTLRFGLDAIQKQIAIAFAPQLKNLVDGFTDFLIANRAVIQDGLKKFFEIVNSGMGAIWHFGELILKLIDNTIGFKNALMLAGAAFLYLNRAALLNPFTLILSVIGGIIAIIDDLYTAMKGGKSVIREWLKEWLHIDIVKVIRGIKEAFVEMVKDVKIAFKNLFTGIKATISNVFNFIKHIFKQIESFINPLIDKIHSISKIKTSFTNKVKNWFGGLFGDDEVKIKKENIVKQDVALTTPYNYKNIALPNAVNNSNVVNKQENNIKVEVKTDNPDIAGKSVVNEIESFLENAKVYFSKGGR